MSLLTRLIALPSLLLILSTQLDARPSTLPGAPKPESWSSIRGKTVCRTHVGALRKDLQLHEAWCADGVEGLVFEARGQLFTCRTVRLSVPFMDSDIDVAAGCVAVREGRQSHAWMAMDKHS